MCAQIGHNQGPSLEGGTSWRKHCWTSAREQLLPHVPIEILRGRLKRAAALGLDYRTYAGIRATTGRDVIAVLFSSNALDLRAGQGSLSARYAEKLAQTQATRIGLATLPLTPEALAAAAPLNGSHAAPPVFAPFRTQTQHLRRALDRIPSDAAILVGAYGAERDWVAAGRLAAYIDAQTFFASP